jgi:hypothetical protein
MRNPFVLSIVFGFALTVPVAASTNLHRPVHSHRTTHHTTVASQSVDPFKPRTTNGLSSNPDACASYGCVGAGGGGD